MNNRCYVMYNERSMGSNHRYVIANTYVCLFLRPVFCKPFVSLVRLFLVLSSVSCFCDGCMPAVSERTTIERTQTTAIDVTKRYIRSEEFLQEIEWRLCTSGRYSRV